MPMPDLDPDRFKKAYLVDPSHTLPIPGTKLFVPLDGILVDTQDPYWRLPLADGSLTLREPPPAPAPADEATSEAPVELAAPPISDEAPPPAASDDYAPSSVSRRRG